MFATETLEKAKKLCEIMEPIMAEHHFYTDEEENSIFDDLLVSPLEKNSSTFDVKCGCTKIVIIFDELPYVIKVPFSGMVIYDYNEDDDIESEYNRFYENAIADDSSDYCADELDRIKGAEEQGFGCVFPETEFLCKINGTSFYIQEKVYDYNNRVGHNYYQSKSQYAKNIVKELQEEGTYNIGYSSWMESFVEIYGVDFLKNLVNWEKEVYADSSMFNDMHGGNYGYKEDGRPCILDASGFRE